MLAVLDASVIVRALIDRGLDARRWLERVARREVDAVVPDLVFVEVGQAFAGYVREGALPRHAALRRLEFVRALPFEVRPLDVLAPAALAIALERELSVYDACYASLAEAEDAVLVTADRRLAGAVDRCELLP
ncbi:MAG: type II toxin-antitoxin system VapC family toxin [Actinomycetota bacterium]